MRMTLACVLAICGTVLLTSPALKASVQAAQAEVQPSKVAINLNLATVDQLETLPGDGATVGGSKDPVGHRAALGRQTLCTCGCNQERC